MNCSMGENDKAFVTRIFFLIFLFPMRELIYLQRLTTYYYLQSTADSP